MRNLIKQKDFYILLSLFAVLIFILNLNHLSQQGIYDSNYLKAAENIVAGNGYSISDAVPALYPLWGYSIMLVPGVWIGAPGIFILFVQLIMTLIGICLFYKIFDLKESIWHILFFVPFIALMSVKWADAPAAFFLLLFAYYSIKYLKIPSWKHLLFSGISLGILANLRSEYLYLPIFIMLLAFLHVFKSSKKHIIILALSSIAAALLLLAPWSLRSVSIDGKYRTSGSNGGAVAYITLGQLPGNSWGVVPSDSVFYSFVASKGIADPFSAKGDSLLKSETLRLIESRPAEYLKKCIYNSYKFMSGGLYTGEYSNIYLGKKGKTEIETYLNSQNLGNIKSIYILFEKGYYFMLFEKLLRLISIPLFFCMILFFVLDKNQRINRKYLYWTVAVFVFYKLTTSALLQYEYRHINAVYLLLLGSFLPNAQIYFEKTKLKLARKR